MFHIRYVLADTVEILLTVQVKNVNLADDKVAYQLLWRQA